MSTDLEIDDNEPEVFLPQTQFKAPPLKPGAKVGIVAPASRPPGPLVLKRCLQVVEEMGFRPVVGAAVLNNTGFTAGSDSERVEDLHNFWQDPSIEALLCASGGYGAARLLPLLDFAQIRKQAKIILGSGDNDALLLAINKLTGLVVLHGPNLDEINDRHTFDSVRSALSLRAETVQINCREPGDASFEAGVYSLSEKICNGIICGGNLSVLTSLFGTRYQPVLQDRILILDDAGERNDILDRWFTTLYLSGTLDQVAGIAFGGFPDCGPGDSNNMLPIEDTFSDRLKEVGTPACFGFKFGLSGKTNVVPVGVQAKLDCATGSLQILETSLAQS